MTRRSLISIQNMMFYGPSGPVDGGGGSGFTESDITGKPVMFAIVGDTQSLPTRLKDPAIDVSEPNVLMWDGTSFVLAEEAIDHEGREFGPDRTSHALAFARDFKDTYNPSHVLLVGMAYDNSKMIGNQRNFIPGDSTYSVHDAIKTRWEAAYANAEPLYSGLVAGGIIFSMGETDVRTNDEYFSSSVQDTPSWRDMMGSFFNFLRYNWNGMDLDTPGLIYGPPNTSYFQDNFLTAYNNMKAANADIANEWNRTGTINVDDLTGANSTDYSASELRTVGSRLSAAYANVLTNNVTDSENTSLFLLDADNVETPIWLDARNLADGSKIVNHGDLGNNFFNQRVNVYNGAMTLWQEKHLRWYGDNNRPLIGTRDFKISFRARGDSTSTQNMFSLYDVSTDQRCLNIQQRFSDIEVYVSDQGSNYLKAIEVDWDGYTMEDFVLKRVGSVMTLTKASSLVGPTHTWDNGTVYDFFDPSGGVPFSISGRTDGDGYRGAMEYFVFEFLS